MTSEPKDGSGQARAFWLLPKIFFRVEWDGHDIEFQEVSGLDAEPDTPDYRTGNAAVISTLKMPGLTKSDKITMKKGVYTEDVAIFAWFADFQMNVIERKAMTISLLGDRGRPSTVWNGQKAFPLKVSPGYIMGRGKDTAVESIEIAHAGITIEIA